MKRIPWIRLQKKTDPEPSIEPPLWFGHRSNGEYFKSATRRDQRIRREILVRADANARRLGMPRRDFLASAMGMATSLLVLNQVSGCSDDTSSGMGKRDSGTGPGGRDAGRMRDAGGMTDAGRMRDAGGDAKYCVPPEAELEEDVACSVFEGNEFIFDVQSHWFEAEDLANFPAYQAAFGPLFRVTTEENYIRQMFCESDTTVAALSSWPGISCTDERTGNCGLPLSNQSSMESRLRINMAAAYTQRTVNHVQVLPQDPSGVEEQLRIMQQYHCTQPGGAAAWKLYPGFAPGFLLSDELGSKVIERGLELGVPRFCVHKGLPIGNFFRVEQNKPADVGVAAKRYPEASFIIYHSAICSGSSNCDEAPPEGPYDPDEPEPRGANALIRSLQDNGIEPNSNVYAEVGSAINEVFRDPMEAAHFFGKLMRYVGTDNVCWGTDCIIYGSPQRFIDQFRALEIPESMQEEFGYPPLDAAQKAKIFGLNSAKLYGLDVEATRCQVETCETAQLKRYMDDEFGKRRWAFEQPLGPKNWSDFVSMSRDCMRLGRPG